jgi:hypothetical protein
MSNHDVGVICNENVSAIALPTAVPNQSPISSDMVWGFAKIIKSSVFGISGAGFFRHNGVRSSFVQWRASGVNRRSLRFSKVHPCLQDIKRETSQMGTTLIKREIPHIFPLIVDGFVWTMIPTLTFFASDEKLDPFSRKCLQGAVIFLGALSGFRSKAFGEYRDGKRRRDETEMLAKAKADTTTSNEGHLR